MTDNAVQPVTVLLAALGGEGGGVLSNWIVEAARAVDLPVQSTSIPGVAQRTGATTYYLEVWPQTYGAMDGRQPVLSLVPAVGEVDLMVATELVEAGRAIGNGFVTPDRTFLIASSHRIFSTREKMAMGDGRFDPAGVRAALQTRSRDRLVVDMAAAARAAGSPVNAVALGLIAGSGLLPVPLDQFERAISAEGKAVDANLRGFRRGLDLARGEQAGEKGRQGHTSEAATTSEGLLARISREFPEAVRDSLVHALGRLCDYQGADYAALYLDRVEPFKDGDPAVLSALARELAVRMSFEDVIRVAQVKIRPERMARVRREAGAAAEDLVTVTEFMKPGVEEICDMLPSPLAKMVLALAARSSGLRNFHLPMRTNSTSVSGFLRLWLLAKARRLRPLTYRYRREQENIEYWLDLVRRAQQRNNELAREVAGCAGLVKGYGDTHRRGMGNFMRLCRDFVEPVLNGERNADGAAEKLAAARRAALDDPDGKALDIALAVEGTRTTTIDEAAA